MVEFFILPTYSYFGDYQILYGLRSQIAYRAGDSNQNRLSITLCLDKDVLLQMMDDYPEARKFYMERSWDRRTEFRRRMRKFYQEFEKQEIFDKFHNKTSSSEDDDSKDKAENSDNDNKNSDEDSDDSEKEESDCEDTVLDDEMIYDKKQLKKSNRLNKAINKKISKFYPIEVNDELGHENEELVDKLQEVSGDEWPIDNSHLIEEDNKKVSFDSI